MTRSPNQQFQKHRCEVNASLREPVIQAPAIRSFLLGSDDPRGLKPLQAVGENVCGDAFARFLKLLEHLVTAHHQIADDQQRPTVSQYIERDAYRAAGPAFCLTGPKHIREVSNITCTLQVTTKHVNLGLAGRASNPGMFLVRRHYARLSRIGSPSLEA